jgi:glyoxylase-like metal-dependent hydrolase (beta-lactamase superfamily II)
MLMVIDHGEVRELSLSTRLGRVAGIKVSAFLVRGTLVDTGFWRARRELAAALERYPVERAILTHWHEDHSGNLGLLAARRIPAVISAATQRHLPARWWLPPYRWAIWGSPETAPLPVAVPLDEAGLELVPTPGHSDDHLAVWDCRTDTVFGGDLFLGVKAASQHAAGDPYAILASVRRIIALRPARYFDAHRGSIREPLAALAAKADWLAASIGQIEAAIDRGDPDSVIRDRVLGSEDPVAWISGFQMSKLNFVRAIRRACTAGPGRGLTAGPRG